MARFHGTVGFVGQSEVSPGDWEANVVTKRQYYGDVLRNQYSYIASSISTNDNIRLSNRISVIADEYMLSNLYNIKFIIWNNTPWSVTEVEINRPRVCLTLGGVYNGNTD